LLPDRTNIAVDAPAPEAPVLPGASTLMR
jgi:hypothetical protein